jgi:hypothetical protein
MSTLSEDETQPMSGGKRGLHRTQRPHKLNKKAIPVTGREGP